MCVNLRQSKRLHNHKEMVCGFDDVLRVMEYDDKDDISLKDDILKMTFAYSGFSTRISTFTDTLV